MMKRNDSPYVSIIVRAFNEQKHIAGLLKGILRQKVAFSFETILVDSGSTDATVQIAESFSVRVVRINPEDFTFGYSLNKGIDSSLGEISVIVSAHCQPTDEYWLANIIKPFEEEKVALAYGKQRGWETTKFSEHQIFKKWFPDHDVNDCEIPFCNNANSAVRKSVWKEYPFDEELMGLEDIAWGKKAMDMGYRIVYRADACVYHIHDENNRQIYRRYYREALAYKSIYKGERFHFLDFLKLFSMNVVGDYLRAFYQRRFFRNCFSILTFRFLQFWATYRAHYHRASVSKAMRRRLYYPKKPKIFHAIAKAKEEKKTMPKYIDVSRPISSAIPVWPGAPSVSVKQVKRLSEDGVNESHLSMNMHTGTHMDAPFHFVEKGNQVRQVAIERMIGEAFIFEHLSSRTIEVDDLLCFNIPGDAKRVLLKTKNSYFLERSGEFNKDFAHISPESAHWLAQRGIELIGTDGPSIQGFYDKDNLTHEILLKANIVVLEGLDLSQVFKEKYQLIALPLNIPEAEAAPARVILMDL